MHKLFTGAFKHKKCGVYKNPAGLNCLYSTLANSVLTEKNMQINFLKIEVKWNRTFIMHVFVQHF